MNTNKPTTKLRRQTCQQHTHKDVSKQLLHAFS